jgi:hypothetical protein
MSQFSELYSAPKVDHYFNVDSSFVSGDSPATHNLKAALGHASLDWFIINDGAADIQVQISSDGLSYADTITVKAGENWDMMGRIAAIVKVLYTGSNSAYRIYAE